jgi:hypothetical protein
MLFKALNGRRRVGVAPMLSSQRNIYVHVDHVATGKRAGLNCIFARKRENHHFRNVVDSDLSTRPLIFERACLPNLSVVN